MSFGEAYKPVLAMVGLQFTYAAIALSSRDALLQGMNPRISVVYRQAAASLVMAPIAYISQRGKPSMFCMGLKSLLLIFAAAFIGITLNQNAYFEGLYLTSSTVAGAMTNLIPAVTFVLAVIVGMEKVNIKSWRSIAKIVGTVICVSGAISMSLLRGPKLLNTTLGLGGDQNWLMGCLILFAGCCCWAIWIILQVPITASCPDNVLLSSIMCYLSFLQSAAFTFFLEPDPSSWKLHSRLEFISCAFTGVASAVVVLVQAWSISKRGPLFCAMFNPLSLVMVAIFEAVFLHEKVYLGSFVGAIAVIIGLYVVLWGKAEDYQEIKQDTIALKPQCDDETSTVQVLVDESYSENAISCKIDLREPLLASVQPHLTKGDL